MIGTCNTNPNELFRESKISNEALKFILFISYAQVIEELKSRFSHETVSRIKGFYCIPALMAKYSNWKRHVKTFMIENKDDMVNVNTFDAEIDLWDTYWLKNWNKELPGTVEETLENFSKLLYPNMYRVLHLLAVLPVTTCSCERSISTLRRIKTYLRNTMGQVSYFPFISLCFFLVFSLY